MWFVCNVFTGSAGFVGLGGLGGLTAFLFFFSLVFFSAAAAAAAATHSLSEATSTSIYSSWSPGGPSKTNPPLALAFPFLELGFGFFLAGIMNCLVYIVHLLWRNWIIQWAALVFIAIVTWFVCNRGTNHSQSQLTVEQLWHDHNRSWSFVWPIIFNRRLIVMIHNRPKYQS